MARFAHVPREAVLKEDLLRTGIDFDVSALTDNLDGEVKPKSYFIFSFKAIRPPCVSSFSGVCSPRAPPRSRRARCGSPVP